MEKFAKQILEYLKTCNVYVLVYLPTVFFFSFLHNFHLQISGKEK